MNDKFSASFNILMNINGKRLDLYENMLNYCKNQRTITKEQLLNIGERIGMSKNQIEDEIIGCLYANYIVSPYYNSKEYTITSRAEKDFLLMGEEGSYERHQCHMTISFEDNTYRLWMWLVESLGQGFVESLIKRKWTRNKSKLRLMKKCKTLEEIVEEVRFIANMIPPYCGQKYAYRELIMECGRYWRNFDTYTVNLCQRREYFSETMMKYSNFYETILNTVGKCVDWGGKEILYKDVVDIAKSHGIYKENFMKESLEDGMFRFLSEDKLTITGHATTIINSYMKKNNRLDIIVRNNGQMKYTLMVGEKTKDSQAVRDLLNSKMKLDDFGWYIYENQGLEHLLNFINHISKLFIDSEQMGFLK